jgi:hypothetical protein
MELACDAFDFDYHVMGGNHRNHIECGSDQRHRNRDDVSHHRSPQKLLARGSCDEASRSVVLKKAGDCHGLATVARRR